MTADDRGAILIFGESQNDTRAILELIAALRADVPRAKLRVMREPISLIKDMNPAGAATRTARVKAAIKAFSARDEVRAVFLHEDADAVEPAHMRLLDGKERPFTDFFCRVYGVVPAWEIETWWFLFPSVVGRVRESWRNPDQYVGRDVGKIQRSKERLIICLRPSPRVGSKFPDYREADAPLVASKIAASGRVRAPEATSQSWTEFVRRVDEL